MIWDPFLSAAEVATGARELVNGNGLVDNHQFYLSSRDFPNAHPDLVDTIIGSLDEVDSWIKANSDDVARQFAPALGIPADDAQDRRAAPAIWHETDRRRMSPPRQQRIADAFLQLGLIPQPIQISEAVKKPQS